MKRGALPLVLLGWPVFGALAASVNANVALYVQFENQPTNTETGGLQRELRAILAPAGFDFVWRPETAAGGEVWAALAVVNFRGHCDSRDLRRPVGHFARGPLGWTHMSDGRVLPFADIDCDRIAAFLETGLLSLPLADRDRVYERALARVLAHELYHVFAQTAGHGSWGVTKAEFQAEELASDNFCFDAGELRALRRKIAQASLQFSLHSR